MLTAVLYTTITLLWGSTWLAIQHQVHHGVAPIWSIIYRFAIASALMLSYCALTRVNLRFSLREHGFMLLQGILFASLNYYFFYLSSQYLLSGIISLVFASVVIMNIFTSYLILKHPITMQIVTGALIGIAGLCLVVWSEVGHMANAHQHTVMHFDLSMLEGIGFCLMAVLCASFGTITASYNRTHNNLPLLQAISISLAYGTCCSLLIALLSHEAPTFNLSWDYVGALFYLTVPGTIIGFAVYIALLERIGPSRIGYTFVLMPIVSLTLSTIFEGFYWTETTFIGVALALFGNILIMRKPKKKLARIFHERSLRG